MSYQQKAEIKKLRKLLRETMKNLYGLYWMDSLYSQPAYKHIPELAKRIKTAMNKRKMPD